HGAQDEFRCVCRGQRCDLSRVSLIAAEGKGSGAPPVREADGARAKITRYEPNRIELTTGNPKDGFLVLSEIYYPGWEARIDGNPIKIYRTDYTLRGIFVPAGERRVEFIYRPQSLRRGALGAALGLTLLALAYPMMRAKYCCLQTTMGKAND